MKWLVIAVVALSIASAVWFVCSGDCRGATVSCLAGAVFCHCAILWEQIKAKIKRMEGSANEKPE